MLKYIYRDEDLVWQLGPYFDHLKTIEARIPAALRDLICEEDRYGLNSERSFHDAWLVFLSLFGPQECEPEDVFTIELSLLGPYHDRYFDLRYLGATVYHVGLTPGSGDLEWIDFRGAKKRKDDLMIHEFDVLADGRIEHRYLFLSGMEIFIQCARIEFSERIIKDGRDGTH